MEPGTVLTLTASEARVFLQCGLVDGSWDALPGGVFLADLYSASEKCAPGDASFTPEWLAAATSFAVVGNGRELRGSDGRRVVTLRPAAARPKVPSSVIAEYGEPPVLTDEERAELDRPLPAFPSGVRPATTADLLGTWVLPGETGDDGMWPHVSFGPDGDWSASDGCNGTRGRWALADGALLMSDGVSTLIGCENIDVAGGAVLAGFDGDTLVFIGDDGQESRRVVSGPAPERGAN